jgi:hypothetical protein
MTILLILLGPVMASPDTMRIRNCGCLNNVHLIALWIQHSPWADHLIQVTVIVPLVDISRLVDEFKTVETLFGLRSSLSDKSDSG